MFKALTLINDSPVPVPFQLLAEPDGEPDGGD